MRDSDLEREEATARYWYEVTGRSYWRGRLLRALLEINRRTR